MATFQNRENRANKGTICTAAKSAVELRKFPVYLARHYPGVNRSFMRDKNGVSPELKLDLSTVEIRMLELSQMAFHFSSHFHGCKFTLTKFALLRN